MALTDAFKHSIKLSIDVQLGAIELVTPVLAKIQILKFYQPHTGTQKAKTSIIAQCKCTKELTRTRSEVSVHSIIELEFRNVGF